MAAFCRNFLTSLLLILFDFIELGVLRDAKPVARLQNFLSKGIYGGWPLHGGSSD